MLAVRSIYFKLGGTDILTLDVSLPTLCSLFNRIRLKRWHAHNSFLSLVFLLFTRSTLSRAVKSTKRESSSSSWLTWSRTMDGSDAEAAPFGFFWPWNDLYWTAWSVDHRPPSLHDPIHPHLLFKKKTKHHPSTNFPPPSRSHTAHPEPERVIRWYTGRGDTLSWKCLFSFADGDLSGLPTPVHSLPSPTPLPNHAYKVIVVIWRPLCERDFTQRMFLCSLYLAHPARRMTVLTFLCFNVICF